MDRTEQLFTESELRALLKREEGQFLELKSLWDRSDGQARALDRRKARDFVAEVVAAFANADGGTLVLGVEDDGTPTGHGYPEEAIRDLLAVPERRLRSAVTCGTQRSSLDGKEVLVFQVPLASEAVMVEGNGFPYRVGDRVLREPQLVINTRKESYRRVGYEQRVRPEASLEDVDLALAQRFLGATVFRERPVEEVLARYGLILPRPGAPAITNACLLLFAKEPMARWHPRAGIRFFRVAGKERQHGAHRNVTQLDRIERPLASAIDEAYRTAKQQIRRSEKLHDLFFREMPEYPDFAWQEAIVNAFGHRDYEDQSRETEVWFYEDRMEVKSPGEPVPPVTLDLLRERKPVHASRNPIVVRVLVEAGLMREEGEGIPRMFDEMEASSLRAPGLDVEAGEFCVTLKNEPVFVGPTPEWQEIVSRLPVGVAQRRVLLSNPHGFTNEDYRRLNRVDRDQAYREIQEMVAAGVVSPAEAPGRGAIYRLSPDLEGERRFLESRVSVLREALSQRPGLKNAEYRALFGLTPLQAKRELKRLVEAGYLRAEGERKGARYLAGPRLEGSR